MLIATYTPEKDAEAEVFSVEGNEKNATILALVLIDNLLAATKSFPRIAEKNHTFR